MDNVRSLLVQILICFITFGVYKILLDDMVESNEWCCPSHPYNVNLDNDSEVREWKRSAMENYTDYLDSLDLNALEEAQTKQI